jgi:hypothetical protein
MMCKEGSRESLIGEDIDGVWVDVRCGVVGRLSQDNVKGLGQCT